MHLGGLDDRGFHAALEIHRRHPGGEQQHALAQHGAGEHGGSGGAIAGDVGGFLGDLADQLGAHVLELVLEIDLLDHGDAVLGDDRRAEAFLDHDVAALGAERDARGFGDQRSALDDPGAGFLMQTDGFG